MQTNLPPKVLVERILLRSICSVQVGAVIEDSHGIFAWGWNHMGPNGLGECAEVSALKRGNLSREKGATLYVAAQRGRNGKAITSRPCLKCQGWLEARGITRVWWRSGDGLWHPL